MRDCDNVDLRERLPELLSERLAGTERERVEAHVHTCAECAGELALLRDARAAIRGEAPRVDADAIARAVTRQLGHAPATELRVVRGDAPARPAARVEMRPAPRPWLSRPMQAAAAVVILALGAGGVTVARDGASARAGSTSAADVAPQGAATVAPTAQSSASEAAPTNSVAMVTPPTHYETGAAAVRASSDIPASALGGTFADLTDEELAAVIRAVDADAGISTEPAPTPNLVTSGPGGAR